MWSQATAVAPADIAASTPAGGVRATATAGPWLLTDCSGRESFADYLTTMPGGRSDHVPGDQVVAVALAAEVRGRGGAGFPLGRKLEAVAGSADLHRVVVANGEEGEPGSVKDRVLVRT